MLLDTVDIVVLLVYLLGVICIGVAASRRVRGGGSTAEYFLAGRGVGWLPVGASLFVSNIGAEHLVGLAGSGAAIGIVVGAWELNALILIQLLSWVYLPIYLRAKVFTVPEYLARRFGGFRLRLLHASISLILYITTRISADLLTAGIFINQALNWDLFASIGALIALAGGITLIGGLRAVIYTETLQMVVIVLGSLLLAALSFSKVGGMAGLVRTFPNTDICGQPWDPWKMLRGPSDPYVPWLGFIFGQTTSSIWYWCADQVIVQRVLASRTISHARGATLLAGFLKLLPLFTMVMPGMIARVLYTREVGCDSPEECFRVCRNKSGCSNIAYSRLVMGLMPTGLRGVMLAALVASLMGSLESTLNSASSLFTLDIWARLRPHASSRERLLVGRTFLLLFTAMSVAWVPIAASSQQGQIFMYMQEASNYLAPQIAALYVVAILWPRANEVGAFWGLCAGFVIGLLRLVASMALFHSQESQVCSPPHASPSHGFATALGLFLGMHHMYFGLLVFLLTAAMVILSSLLTAPPSPSLLKGTTVWSDSIVHKVTHQGEESKDAGDMDDGPHHHGYEQQVGGERSKGLGRGDDEDETGRRRRRKRGDGARLEEEAVAKIAGDYDHHQDDEEEEEDEERGREQHVEQQHPHPSHAIEDTEEEVQEEGEEEEEDEHLRQRLHVTKAEEVVLTAGLVLVGLMGLASYILWSFWRPQKTFAAKQ